MQQNTATNQKTLTESKIKYRHSLTFHTLLAMGIRITLVVIAVSLMSYWHITETLESQTQDKLHHYIKERGDKESALFESANSTHLVFKYAMLQLIQSGQKVSQQQFDNLFEAKDDRTTRMRAQYYHGMIGENGLKYENHSGYIGMNAPLNEQKFRDRLVYAHQLLKQYGPAWTIRFANLYLSSPENAVMVYWPGYAWGSDAEPDLHVKDHEWGYVADIDNNPERKTVWTGMYYDDIASEWMVSVETPIDYQGQHIFTLGQDLTLNDLFVRVINDHLEGSHNFIFREDGRLIAHPDKMNELKQADGKIKIQDMGDDKLSYQYQLVMEHMRSKSEDSTVLFDNKNGEFLAINQIKGPDWWFVTVFPQELLASAAQSTAEFVLLLGVFSLVLELLMLYLVLRFKVIHPLEAFVNVSNKVKQGCYAQVASGEIPLPVKRKDEVGLLARMLYTMSGTIEDNIATLKHMDKLKDDFMANTSHELRTPLNGIVGIAESMLDGACGELTQNQRQNLSLLVSSGHRLAHLVDDILDFSKLKHQELALKRKAVDVHGLTEEVLLFTRHLLKGKKIRMLNQVSNDVPLVYADEHRVQQILYNLIGNAIKFTNDGMICVTARVWRDHISINVSDTGIGIADDKQAQIFESYEHAEGLAGPSNGGTGIGLALTKRLVELHKGTIKVVSCEGKGSEFSFTLPICTDSLLKQLEEQEAEDADSEAPEQAGESNSVLSRVHDNSQSQVLIEPSVVHGKGDENCLGQILVVDDEAINIQVLSNHLSVNHYGVVSASSGLEALDKIHSEPMFDAVLLDVMMPNMTGYEVCRRVRQKYPANQLPILMVTTKRGVDEMTACFEAGANDYLSKPVSKAELLQRIKTHIGIVKLNQDLTKAHDMLKAHAQELEERVKIKAQKLAKHDDQLRQTNQQLQDVTQQFSRSHIDIKTLAELGKDLTSTLELNQVIKNIYRTLNKVLDAYTFMLGILDVDNEVIHVPLIVKNDQKLTSVDYQLSETSEPAVWCVTQRKELLIFESADRDAYFEQSLTKAQELQTAVYFPLIIGDKVVGFLSVEHPDEHAYNNEQVDMLRTLAGFSAVAIANANGYAKLEQAHQAMKEAQKQMVLQEKMASLGTLTAGVAHEINNPTNFVHVGAQNLQSDLQRFHQFILDLAGDDADEEILETLDAHFFPLNDHIDTMINGTQRIKTIVQDLRSFTHLHSTDKKPADIIDCLVSTVSLVKTQYQDVTEFITDFKTLPKLVCYPAQLNQVFMNIIVNACDAIGEKQTEQKSKLHGQIRLSCEFVEGHICVMIADNGCGMSEQTRLKLYEPFYTTKPVGVGTGLGMAISFGIIEDHGGTITAASVEGEGSEITVRLPLV